MQVRVREGISVQPRTAKLRLLRGKTECTAEGRVQWVARGDVGVSFERVDPALVDWVRKLEPLSSPNRHAQTEVTEVEIELS
jgi:hypothetical protein